MTNSPQNIEVALFDLDGTLIDTYEAILRSMQHTMKVMQKKEYPPEQLMKKVGQPLRTQMMDYARSEKECDQYLRVYREYQAKIHDDLVKPFDGTFETLERLRERGYVLGVVTSKLHAFAQHGLETCGLEGFFTCLVGADDCVKHKPDPAPVAYGAELIGVAVEKCFYIGDSPYDIQAGNAAGATTVAALWGMFPERDLMAEKPDYSRDCIADVPALLHLSQTRDIF